MQAMEQLYQQNVSMRRQVEDLQKHRNEGETYMTEGPNDTSYAQKGITHGSEAAVDLAGHPFSSAIMEAPFP